MGAWKVGAELRAIDETARRSSSTWPASDEPRHPAALVPLNIYRRQGAARSLLRLGEWVADHGIDADGDRCRAARDLLLAAPAARSGRRPATPFGSPGETELDAACRLGVALIDGTLAIQGPPGSGKTYTGARMIVRLLAAGKRVGHHRQRATR